MAASQDVDMMDASHSNGIHIADPAMVERELNEKYAQSTWNI